MPGVIILRPEAGIVFFNADFVQDSLIARVRKSQAPVHTVICDLSAVPLMDLAGAEMMKRLEEELRVLGVHLQIVEARATVRDRLRAEGPEEERARRVDRFTAVAEAVDAALAGCREVPRTVGQPRVCSLSAEE